MHREHVLSIGSGSDHEKVTRYSSFSFPFCYERPPRISDEPAHIENCLQAGFASGYLVKTLKVPHDVVRALPCEKDVHGFPSQFLGRFLLAGGA